MDLYVIRGPSAWANLQELEAAGAKSGKVGNEEMADRVRWIRSYVVKEPDGRLGTVCIKRGILNRSASMRAASACLATRFFRSSRPPSSATIRRKQAPLPEDLNHERANRHSRHHRSCHDQGPPTCRLGLR